MTRASRILTRTALVLGALLLLVLAGLVILLASPGAARQVIGFALGRPAAKGLQIAEIRGPLRGPLVLLGIEYRSGALSAEIDSALIDWNPAALLLGRVELSRVHLTGFRIVLPDSAPRDTAGTVRARLERPSTPLPVMLGDVRVRDLQVEAPGDVDIVADSVRLEGRVQAYGFALSGTLTAPYTGVVPVRLGGTGSLVDIQIRHGEARPYDGKMQATGTVAWWPTTHWDLTVRADSIRSELIHPALGQWPGRIRFTGVTAGAMDTAGFSGQARIDSLGGSVRGQPLSGHGTIGFGRDRLTLSGLDVAWGSTRLEADGALDHERGITYTARIGNLRTLTRQARGALTVHGTARGPAERPRLQARLEGQRLAWGTSGVGRLVGSLDVELAPRGRSNVTLRGNRAVLATGRFDSLALDLRGRFPDHRLSMRLRGASDTIRLAARGALTGRSWRGVLDSLVVRTAQLGGWRLVSPGAVAVSPPAGRLQRLCLAGDSVGERVCAEGTWQSARTWNVLATLQGLSAARFSPGRNGLLREDARLAGTLGARLEAQARNGRVNGILRAAADTVLLLYPGEDGSERRLALDSAVVSIRSDQAATQAALGVRVLDEASTEQVVLSGLARLPPYRIGMRLAAQPMELDLAGNVPNLGFFEPLLFGIDSLAGSLGFTASVQGTLARPRGTARVALQQFGIGLPGHRALSGSAELIAGGGMGARNALEGEARLTTRNAGYEYWYHSGQRRLNLDSGLAVVRVGADGLRGNLGLAVSDPEGVGVGDVSATISLPQFRRAGEPLGPQPVTASLEARIPDLAMLQPLVLRIDSLAGRLDLGLTAEGRVGAPSLTGTLRIEEFQGRLPTGTVARGGLHGDLDVAVTADDRMSGTLRLEPRNATFTLPAGEQSRLMRLDRTAVELAAGPEGVRGSLDAALVDTARGELVSLEGRLAIPGLTRMTEPLAAQRVEGSFEGRATDLAFLSALTELIDSAAGQGRLDANITGTLGDTRVVGSFALSDATVRLPALGIELENIQFTGRGGPAGLAEVRGSLESGGGQLTIEGTTPFLPTASRPGRLAIRGNRFEVVNTEQFHALVTPRLDVRMAGDSLDVRGELELPVARLVIERVPETAIRSSDDVIILDSVRVSRPGRPVTADIRLILGDTVSFAAFNFDAEMRGSLVVRAAPDRLPTGTGTLRIEEGHYRAYGQDLTIRGGEVRYLGGPLDNPGLAITATRSVQARGDTVVAGLRIGGTAKSPTVRLFSTPAMSETQTLSYLLTGRPAGEGGVGGNLLSRALASLGLKGGTLLAEAVGQQVGLADLSLSAEDDFRDTALQIGRYLSPDLYVSYAIGVFDPVSTLRLRYVLSSRITILAETGRESSADVLIRQQPDPPRER